MAASPANRRPADDEFSLDYQRDLVAKLEGDDLTKILNDQLFWTCELGGHISADQADKVHSPYQWTIRQVFEHCANAERVFGYRMLRAAAGDSTPLTSWDENAYAEERFGLGTMSNLITELGTLRQSNLMLAGRVLPRCWDQTVTVDGTAISFRSMAWLAAAHVHHHFCIIEQRCGLQVQRSLK